MWHGVGSPGADGLHWHRGISIENAACRLALTTGEGGE